MKMFCFKKCDILILILILLNENIIFGAPQTDGYTYPTDDEDRVMSHVIDPTSNETELFTMDSTNSDDKVVSTVIDINGSDNSQLFNQFNISIDEVLRRINKQHQSNQPKNEESGRIVNSDQRDENRESVDKGEYIEMFKQKIMSSVDRKSNESHGDLSDSTIHNAAFYPVCSLNNETSWLAENTAKLYFSHQLLLKLEPNTILRNAKLRLKQKDPDQLEEPQPTPCGEPDEIIRVTVSVFVRRSIKGGNNRTANSRRASSRREMKSKKRFCTSFTTPKNYSGWIDIDVRQVIRQWEKAYRANHRGGQAVNDPMLTIDVEDQDQNQLKAGLFFEPTDCKASTPAIPWSFYGPEDIRNINGDSPLPSYPRLDIQYSFHNSNNTLNSHRQNNHNNHHHRHQHRKIVNRYDSNNYDSLVADEPERRNFQHLSEQQLQHRQRHLQNRQQHWHHITEDLTE